MTMKNPKLLVKLTTPLNYLPIKNLFSNNNTVILSKKPRFVIILILIKTTTILSI